MSRSRRTGPERVLECRVRCEELLDELTGQLREASERRKKERDQRKRMVRLLSDDESESGLKEENDGNVRCSSGSSCL